MSGQAILLNLPASMNALLEAWTRNMDRAGYLEHTTAKRRDCVLSFEWFLEPLLEQIRGQDTVPDFTALIQGETDWADPLVQTSRRHRSRGVTAEMFIGCFKTLVQAVEEVIQNLDQPRTEKSGALELVRRYADAFETIIIRDWTAASTREVQDRLDESNRLLTLGKNKYENILAAISDLVLVLDASGTILEANQAAKRSLDDERIEGRFIGNALGLEGRNIDEILKYYPPADQHELSLGEERFFAMKLAPLKMVSLASTGFIVVLSNITGHVMQRATLEQIVDERTEALRAEKGRLEEMNITLKNVLSTIEQDREELKQSIAHTVESVLLPALSKVRSNPADDVRKGYLDILEDQLIKLTPRTASSTDPRLLKLTSTEMRICQFIQAGSSSKDIAEALNLSIGTIQTHRKNIRHKLGLKGSSANLYSFLQACRHPDTPSEHPS